MPKYDNAKRIKNKYPLDFPIAWTHVTATVYPKKYAHGFVVLCFVVVMQSFIMNSHEVFIHIHQGCFAGTGAIVRLSQCQWSKPDGYGKISQCITTTKHSKAKTVCIFLGIYCMSSSLIYMILHPRKSVSFLFNTGCFFRDAFNNSKTGISATHFIRILWNKIRKSL